MDTDKLLEERGKTHGLFSDHASITQRTKDLWKSMEKYKTLTYSQREALDMIAHKVGRVLSGNPHFHDHWADIAGYARLVEKEVSNAAGYSEGNEPLLPLSPAPYVEPVETPVDELRRLARAGRV